MVRASCRLRDARISVRSMLRERLPRNANRSRRVIAVSGCGSSGSANVTVLKPNQVNLEASNAWIGWSSDKEGAGGGCVSG